MLHMPDTLADLDRLEREADRQEEQLNHRITRMLVDSHKALREALRQDIKERNRLNQGVCQ